MVDPKKTSSYLPLCRKKDGGTNYVPWRRFTDDRLRLLYADVYLEFSQPANVETPDEALARLHLLYPLEPLLSETTSVVPQAVFDLWVDEPNINIRTREFAIGIEAERNANRIVNDTRRRINADRAKLVSQAMKKRTEMEKMRLEMSAALLGPEFVSPDCLVTIMADGRFLGGVGEWTPAYTIHTIIQDRLQQCPGPLSEQRLKAGIRIRTMRQGNTRLDVFIRMMKEERDTCASLGVVIAEEELREIFVSALNVEVFATYREEFFRHPDQAPATLNATFLDIVDYYSRRCAAVPALGNVLGDSTGFAVYAIYDATYPGEPYPDTLPPAISAVGSIKPEDKIMDKVPDKPIAGKVLCQLCLKPNHSAQQCFTLRDASKVKGYVDEIGRVQALKSAGVPGSGAGNGTGVGTGGPATSMVAVEFSTFAVCETICSATLDEGIDGLIDFQHDDHSAVHIIGTADAVSFFESLEESGISLGGFTSNMNVKAEGTGALINDMGDGYLVKEARCNLLSAIQLRKNYDRIESSGTDFIYQHRVLGSSITFRLEADGYFHTRLVSPEGWGVSAVDFYNPPPLVPVPAAKSAKTWAAIHDVERLHWATNHAGANAMKELCREATYLGSITSSAIDLFYRHRGCSACSIGRMRHHAQLPSTRGLSGIVGHTVQGDFFFIENGDLKIPVLLLTDECTMFTFMFAFITGDRSSTSTRTMCSKPQFKRAVTAMLSVWTRAGRTCKVLRFDREGLIVSEDSTAWLSERGIRLSPTAADQKLGYMEVQGRIIKDTCRAVVSGVRERFGYTFPKVYYPSVVGDCCAMLNRMCRGESVMSAYAMMFDDPSGGLDIRRDLRVSVGEIVLSKTPRQMVTSIGHPKAEWGIVVSRSFNGSGVYEVHLLDGGDRPTRVHRFKFVRNVAIPEHIMDLARKLDAAVLIAPPPPVPEPALPLAAGDDQVDPVEDPMEADEGEDPIEPEMETVAMAQISYSRGLKQSPARAQQAMRAEIQGYLDRGLFQPVHYSDIPDENRPYILPSLTGYKDRVGQPTGKARVFVDGSRQLPELVGDAYSPVARPESTMFQLGIAAKRGWMVASCDVKQAFTLAARPAGRDLYRYVRLSKDIVAVVISLAPHMSEFVCADGSMLVLMVYMLYGYVEAGQQWFDHQMGIYLDFGFTMNLADPCVIHYSSPSGTVVGSVTVDDTLFCYSSPEVFAEVETMYRNAFGVDGYTTEKGLEFMHLGMKLVQNPEDKSIAVSQWAFVEELVVQAAPMMEKFGAKRGLTPSDPDIFDGKEDSVALDERDRDIYRSLNMSVMFAATRTYPECLVAASALASRFVKATEDDMRRLLKTIQYMAGDPQHCLTIRPASEIIVCSADCSYAIHPDGYSQDGVALGFQGDGDVPDSFFVFRSGKQTTIAKSSCHGELTSANIGADYIVWARQLLEGFGVCHSPSTLERHGLPDPDSESLQASTLRQDNQSTIHLIVRGRGSFRNSKHIRVREHFVRDLVRDGEIVVVWQHTSLMVADLMTKGATRAVFFTLLPSLIGRRCGE